MRMAMMAITTSNSISVKPRRRSRVRVRQIIRNYLQGDEEGINGLSRSEVPLWKPGPFAERAADILVIGILHSVATAVPWGEDQRRGSEFHCRLWQGGKRVPLE